jgi:hypothetical protein
MVWPRTGSTKRERGAKHAASKEVARRRRLAEPATDCVGADYFSLLIRSAPLPKGIKLSDGIVKFNGQ